ncbi:MAG: hypothetical protein ACSLFA_23770, partial [Mycobacterium sp.]
PVDPVRQEESAPRRRRAPEPQAEPQPMPTPGPDAQDRRSRHTGSDANPAAGPRRARHAVPGEAGQQPQRPRRAAAPEPAPAVPAPNPAARHRSADDTAQPAEQPEEDGGQHAGGQPVSELLSRLQAVPTGGGRRRRREE